MKLLVIVEQTSSGYSAYSPDLPGALRRGRLATSSMSG
jgi:predicted RNase H-like HicB family nuclease